jgi:hypothetical protein
MSHVDPAELASTPSPQQLLQAFDRVLGRPPFSCTVEALDAARRLRDVVVSKPLAELRLASGIVSDLPIIATSLALGFSSSTNGFLDARPLVLILCECLAHVASILKFPLQDFLAVTRSTFPMCHETVALHRACGAIDMDILKIFLGVPAEPQPRAVSGKTPAPATSQGKKKSQGSEGSKKGGAPSPAEVKSAAVAPSLSTSTLQQSTPPPEVIKELCLASLSPEGRKLLLKQLDSAAKFSSVVGNNAELASIILNIYGAQLIPLLKPSALIPCMSVGIADIFVELLDKHAVSLAVILDHEFQSNAFALPPMTSSTTTQWCTRTVASSILSSICRRDILRGAESSTPLGFVVGVILWLRVYIAPMNATASGHTSASLVLDDPIHDSNLRILGHLTLDAVAALGAQQQRLGPQRWLIPLRQVLELMTCLLDTNDMHMLLTQHQRILVEYVSPLLRTATAPPAVISIVAKNNSSAKHKAVKNSAEATLPAVPELTVLDSQSLVVALLETVTHWADCASDSSQELTAIWNAAVDALVPWCCITSTRKEVVDAVSSFLVSACLVCHVYLMSSEGRSTIAILIRAPSINVARVIDQLCSPKSTAAGMLTVAVDSLLGSIMSTTTASSIKELRDAFIVLIKHRSVAEVASFIVSFCHRPQSITPDTILNRIECLSSGFAAIDDVVSLAKDELRILTQKQAEVEQQLQAQRVAQASHAVEEERRKRDQQAKELDTMRKQYAAMMARRDKLSQAAAERLASADVAREKLTTSRKTAAHENLNALRNSELQAKKDREAALRSSVASYRERIAQTRNVTTFLKSLGIPDARAFAIPRELQSRLLSLSPQEVMEYIVHGNASMPHDLPTAAQRYEQREASLQQQIIFTDDVFASCTAAADSKQSPSFWDLVMADVESQQAPGGQAPTTDTNTSGRDPAAQALSFHFRVAPLLDLFTFSNAESEASENDGPPSKPRLSLPVRHVKQHLEQPCGQEGLGSLSDTTSITMASSCGFDDALHMVYAAQQKGLVKLEKGVVVLTPFGHAYHEDFWDPTRSFDAILTHRREAAQAALMLAESSAENHNEACDDDDDDDAFDDEDVNWFGDELI